jgi:hypothetical protein
MNNYYKPTEEEFVEDLEIELYDEEEGGWLSHTLSSNSSSSFLPLLKAGDIRVKYLNSVDFNILGLIVKKEFVKQQDVIIDIIPQLDGTNKEVMGKEDIFDEHNLTILKNSLKIGVFHPVPVMEKGIQYNVILQGKKYLVKNLTELRKILK